MIYTSITAGKDPVRPDIHNVTGYNKFKQPVMNAKFPKVCPHFFLDAPQSIWVDGNVRLLRPESYYYELLGAYDIGVFRHPTRNCLYAEAEACKGYKFDHSVVLDRQTSYYRQLNYPENAGLGACFLIVRRHTPEIRSLCETWWAHICAFSKRDQVSFPFVFHRRVRYFDQLHSDWFTRGPHAPVTIPENQLESHL